MAKTLRIGFAMGGGVSLGTFNGAALTETLKLAILRGGFDEVEVDCFSGASAGAMSLAILLRGLVHQTPEQKDKARASLIAQYQTEFSDLSARQQDNLIAAQVVQDVQEQLWVRDISIEKLLADDSPVEAPLKHAASLLNRVAVERIARKAIEFEGDKLDLSQRKLLADRVLFGCALTNLTPILADARKEFTGDDYFLRALSDGMTSLTHREMRVFDLMFRSVGLKKLDTDAEVHPKRWYRYRAGDKAENIVSDLRSRKAWSVIASTAVASGAFPGAFEPVVLTRYDFEFGKELWPLEATSHPFTYADGGTLNNEPIRECFRMAAFLDARKGMADATRWIVFVDPNVASPKPSLKVPMHQRWRMQDPNWLGTFDGWDLNRLSSLDRLLPFAGALLSVISNESGGVEGDKIFQTHKRFELRGNIRTLLSVALDNSPDGLILQGLYDFIDQQLQCNRDGMLIPPGALTVQGELIRVCNEEPMLQPLRDRIADAIASPATVADKGLWLRALAFVAVDLVMDLTGKSPTTLVAIAPERPLPGGALSGFAGFMSEVPGEFEVAAARYRAREMLEAAKLIEPRDGPVKPAKPVFSDENMAAFAQDIRARGPVLIKRLISVVDDCHITLASVLPDWILRAILDKKFNAIVEDMFRPADSRPGKYEFHVVIPVGLKGLQLDGKGFADKDIRPVDCDGVSKLISFATVADGRWSGVHVNKEGTMLIVQQRLHGTFCQIALPQGMQLTLAESMPNPVFQMTLQPDHRKSVVAASCWGPCAGTGVTPLEEGLFV